MFIQPVSFFNLRNNNLNIQNNNIGPFTSKFGLTYNKNLATDTFIKTSVSSPISPSKISFTSGKTDSANFLKGLEGIHDPYSGVLMLTQNQVMQIGTEIRNSKSTSAKIETLSNYESSMLPTEQKIFTYLKDTNKRDKNIPLNKMLKNLEPKATKGLLKEKNDILTQIADLSENLPEEKQKEIQDMVRLARKRLPLPNSNKKHFREAPFITKLTFLSEEDNLKTIKDKISLIPDIKSRSVALKNFRNVSDSLRSFPVDTNVRDNKTSIDLVRDLQQEYAPETLGKSNDMQDILNSAKKLSESKNSINAFIVNNCNNTENEIAGNLLNPSVITIEHIKPHSLGGGNGIKNFMMSTKAMNEERGNMPISEFQKKHPKIPQYCQGYADDIVCAANNGKIRGHELYPYYFQDTMKKEFNLDIDVSKYDLSKEDANEILQERTRTYFQKQNQ